MKKSKNNVYVLQEEDTRNGGADVAAEVMLAVMMLAGILFSVQELGYSKICSAVGLIVGICVIILYQLTERRESIHRKFRMGLYIAGIACFVLTIRLLIQGFLFTVDQVLYLWNVRFGTEAELLVTTEAAGIGSVILWGLLSVCIAWFLLIQLKKRATGGILLLCLPALAFETILGQGSTWKAVILLLASVLGLFIFYSSPGKWAGIRSVCIMGVQCVMILVICLAANGYQRLGSLEQWKYETSREIQKIRYGEDSLPQGSLKKASGLLDGDEDTLEVTTENPTELYLRGFVGGEYKETYWKALSASKYQGDYAGMLNWLDDKDFEPVTQYAQYLHLTQKESGNETEDERVQVKNTGAYRKYLYLPATASGWSTGNADARKDWQVQSGGLFGAFHYQYRSVAAAGTADEVYPSSWLETPSDETENQYLDAESVYHSFAEDSYMEVSDELEPTIKEVFFENQADLSDMDFTDVTTQIRKVLRTETTYTEKPQNPSDGTDTVEWFLKDYKKGNAVYYASAAVMAYRVAGYPARYAEGYHLSAEDAQAMADDGQTTAQLTTKNAHAWVEVYISGMGWLPVEVVPGMYVETYTNQRVEGKAAYQVNVSSSDSGIGTDQGGSEETGEGKGLNQPKERNVVPTIVAGVILILYGIFFLYLILELQRAVRLAKRDRERKNAMEQGICAQYCTRRVEYLMKIAGIKAQSEYMEDNWDEIQSKIPGVTREELARAAELIQKEYFGGKELKAYEYRTLESLADRLERILISRGKPFEKLLYRYFWVLKK